MHLVDFPERKGKIEDANKTVVQHFHSKLTEDMGLLHRTVSISVSQQESQLKSLEEGMQSFIFSKGKVRKKNKACDFQWMFHLYEFNHVIFLRLPESFRSM